MWYIIVYDNYDCYTVYDNEEELKKQVENLAHDGFFQGDHYNIYEIKKIEKKLKTLWKSLDKSNEMWSNMYVIKVRGN